MEQLLNRNTAAQMVGVSTRTIDRLRERGDFPVAVAISLDKTGKPAKVGFKSSEIEGWINSRKRLLK